MQLPIDTPKLCCYYFEYNLLFTVYKAYTVCVISFNGNIVYIN
jgi:hypothetical protein